MYLFEDVHWISTKLRYTLESRERLSDDASSLVMVYRELVPSYLTSNHGIVGARAHESAGRVDHYGRFSEEQGKLACDRAFAQNTLASGRLYNVKHYDDL